MRMVPKTCLQTIIRKAMVNKLCLLIIILKKTILRLTSTLSLCLVLPKQKDMVTYRQHTALSIRKPSILYLPAIITEEMTLKTCLLLIILIIWELSTLTVSITCLLTLSLIIHNLLMSYLLAISFMVHKKQVLQKSVAASRRIQM
uniref:Uncharacterized protein n=1 Tax=Cacopsylla melanoneura TaxID=428564 RepID=A0A8D8YP11_9HEMI